MPGSVCLGGIVILQGCQNLFVGVFCSGVAIARVLTGLVGARFGGVLAAPRLEICSKGRGVVRRLLWVILSGGQTWA